MARTGHILSTYPRNDMARPAGAGAVWAGRVPIWEGTATKWGS